jgi:hypothetical protein
LRAGPCGVMKANQVQNSMEKIGEEFILKTKPMAFA